MQLSRQKGGVSNHVRKDPFETNNLAIDPGYSQRIKDLFSELKRELAILKDELG